MIRLFVKLSPSVQEPKTIVDVTLILNVWKRNYIVEQINSILAQSVQPKYIWIVQYENFVSLSKILRKNKDIKYIHSTENLKYYGRFSLATYVTTQYTWVLDDDIIPGSSWLENCCRLSENSNSIICSNGRIIGNKDYRPEAPQRHLQTEFIGDAVFPHSFNYCSLNTYVDYGCSSYFFKAEWLKYFWSIWPFTLQTGEDIHLSATCKTLANVSTVVPKQLVIEDSGNTKPAYSHDDYASWIKSDFVDQRETVLKYLIDQKSWKPLLWSSQ